MAQAPSSTQLDQPLRQSPLIREPLSSHSVETMLAACRAAIANGEDVNALDTEPHMGFNEGRPLDACLRQTRMPGKKNVMENLPVIELLLEHGADPRLYSRTVGPQCIPISLARSCSTREVTEEGREFFKHLVKIFEEAIERLDAKKKEEEEEEAKLETEEEAKPKTEAKDHV